MYLKKHSREAICSLLALSFVLQFQSSALAFEDADQFTLPGPPIALAREAIALTAPQQGADTKNTYGNFTIDGPLAAASESEIDDASESLYAASQPLYTASESLYLAGEQALLPAPPLDGGEPASTEVASAESFETIASASLPPVSPVKIAATPKSEQFMLSGATSISPDEAVGKVDQLTKEILLKEIELQKFNLHYTTEVARQGRWKGIRYAAFQELNSGAGLAGAIISVANRGSYLHRAQGVKRFAQESANYIPMIGCIVGASAAALEFSINGYHDLVARRKGFAPGVAVKHVEGLRQDIDSLMAERDALIAVEAASPSHVGHVEIDRLEGKVLRDLRDQSLQEFQRFHIGARKLIAFQQMQYLFDIAKNTTGAIGYDFAYLSLHRKERIWNGRAGVLFIVSGQLTMWGPVLSRFFAKGVGEITKHRSKNVVKDIDKNVATLETDLAMLNKIIHDGHGQNIMVANATTREGLYGEHQKAFASEIAAAQKKNAAAKLSATQNIGAGMLVGASKTASGVLFAIPGFNSNYNSQTVRAGRVTNDLLFSASVVALPAGLFSMIDTLRIQVQGEINRHKAAKAGTLPGQIVAARLRQLDEMEANLKRK